jgi:hypothetical protein
MQQSDGVISIESPNGTLQSGVPQSWNTNGGVPQSWNTINGIPQSSNTNGVPQSWNTNGGIPQSWNPNGIPQSWSKQRAKQRWNSKTNQKPNDVRLERILRQRDKWFIQEPQRLDQYCDQWNTYNQMLVSCKREPCARRNQLVYLKYMTRAMDEKKRIESQYYQKHYLTRLINCMMFFFDQYEWNPSICNEQKWCTDAHEYLLLHKSHLIPVHILTAIRRRLFSIIKQYSGYLVRNKSAMITTRCQAIDTQTRFTLADLYIWQFESEHTTVDYTHKDICERCKRPMILIKKQAMMTCKCSGVMVPYQNMTNSASEYGKTNTVATSEYERLKFCVQWLSQYRAGSKKIEPDVVYKVKMKLLERGYNNKHEVKMTTVKNVLKELGLKQYIKHHAKLANIINGVKHSEFTDEQYQEVLERLNMIEVAFSKLKGTDLIKRENFPNLPFVVAQIVRTNNWTEHMQTFRVQRVANSLKKQMQDWQVFTSVLQQIDKKHKWPCLPPN